jgi:hypothetical protein
MLQTSADAITNIDQHSIRSGITIVPSCSTSSLNMQREQYPPLHGSCNTVTMIDETDSALSINANSIDSSILTEFSGSHFISSVDSLENDEPSLDEQTFMDFDEATNENARYQSHEERMEKSCWYHHFESEQKWDKFHEETKQLLDAVDCSEEERDEVIAQLISMEEQMFWNSDGDQGCEGIMYTHALPRLIEVAALSASIAFAGIVMVRFLRAR